MPVFLDGAIAMGCLIAGLFFLRFWRDSRDGLFLNFALAFWIFAINYGVLGLVPFAHEKRPYVLPAPTRGFHYHPVWDRAEEQEEVNRVLATRPQCFDQQLMRAKLEYLASVGRYEAPWLL